MSYDLSDYVQVKDRIIEFYKQYPNGLISTQAAEIRNIADHWFIAVMAEGHLDRTDPSSRFFAEAWEPFPGKTPYTRDSEQLNCATSAIGKLLAQLGIGIKDGMASREEVANRQTGDAAKPAQPQKYGTLKNSATEKQIGLVKAKLKAAGIYEMHDQLDALSKFLGREIMSYESVNRGDIDGIANATPEQLKGVASLQPVEEADPWAGTSW